MFDVWVFDDRGQQTKVSIMIILDVLSIFIDSQLCAECK